MRNPSRLATTLAAAATLLAGMTFSALPAHAAPVYQVMNTSESLPDGVYFRYAPAWNSTNREVGHGVYVGERVELTCYSWGEAVGAYANRLWYWTTNVTRPSINGHANTGYLNAHYVNDGMSSNQVAAGVAECGVPAPAPVPAPTPTTALYYSPFGHGGWDAPGAPAVQTRAKLEWSIGDCNTSRATSGVRATDGVLAGWSIGRLGPPYFLAQASAAQWQQVDYVLMIDPGSYGEMAFPGCDSRALQTPNGSKWAGQLVAEWLMANPNARLVILAGDLTADTARPMNGRAHAGIQSFYLNDIRSAGSSARSRTLVCNYWVPGTNPKSDASLNKSHKIMYNASKKYILSAPQTCPKLDGATSGAAWHP